MLNVQSNFVIMNLVVNMHAMSFVHHTDLSVGAERLMTMKKGQKINHFYGMLAICRKKSLFRSLSTMHKYAHQPLTWTSSFILTHKLIMFSLYSLITNMGVKF